MWRRALALAALCCLAATTGYGTARSAGGAGATSPTPAPTFTAIPVPLPLPTVALGAIGTPCRAYPPTPTPSGPVPGPCGESVPVPFLPGSTLPPAPGAALTTVATDINLGLPAIPTRAAPADPSAPAFTAQDAADYALAHSGGFRIEPIGPVMVVRVEFLTARQAGREASGLAVSGDRLLCVVEVRGRFAVSGPPGIRPNGAPVSTVTLVFDARTGNLLQQGAR